MTRPSRKRKMLDAAYNRYAFNDDNLPDWFAEDESRHNRPQIPVTKEMVDAIKARYKDLAAKPTHKVAEARARKKRRLVQKIDGIKRKASAIADQVCIYVHMYAVIYSYLLDMSVCSTSLFIVFIYLCTWMDGWIYVSWYVYLHAVTRSY